jgi:hypothetical protein
METFVPNLSIVRQPTGCVLDKFLASRLLTKGEFLAFKQPTGKKFIQHTTRWLLHYGKIRNKSFHNVLYDR